MQGGTNTYYDPEKRRTPWLRLTFMILGFIVIIFIIILFMKMFSKGPDLYSSLLASSKEYCSNNNYPESIGECETITLEDLENTNLIDAANYSKCDTSDTLVKVCKIDNDSYQYTPILSCSNKTTSFGEWKSGTIDDLKAGNSEVSFKFVGEVLEKGVRTYYPDNLTDVSKVSQYYVTSPSTDYIYKSDGAIAYKWYTEGEGKEYYKDGAYLSVQPDGYTLKDNEKTSTYVSISKPNTVSYRTITDGTIYATEYMSYAYKYLCVDSRYKETITSNTICELRNTGSYGTTSKIYYTCDGTNDVSIDTVCKSRGNWTSTNCTNSKQTYKGTTSDEYSYTRQLSTGDPCISASGYLVTDKLWQWYKIVNQNTYYPSKSTDVNKENTYYVSTPVAGASKDESTEVTAYKYYKLVQTDSNVESWISISDESLTEEELINKFKDLGYDISKLSDIINNEKINYQIEISYRDRK